MRERIYRGLNKTYGVLMFISFFGGFIPLIPFIICIIIGGTGAEKISVFLYEQYYPWVIVLGSIAIVIGLIAMYVAKIEGLSVKNANAEKMR